MGFRLSNIIRSKASSSKGVPKGYLAVYVGDKMKRSAAAATKLEEAGFQNVACITSGLQTVKPRTIESVGSTELQNAGKAGKISVVLGTDLIYNAGSTSIGMTPFQALYGGAPLSLNSYVAGTLEIESLDESLHRRTETLQLLKNNLTRARSKRRDKEFSEGQWVYLKLQPYRQVSVHRRSLQELSKRFYRPFRIHRHIGPVAYELDLPVRE
ncbi:hypothetical protein TSUD_257970 [Trifolium subterraneum]|uniref:Tf2-1-like SH3-like domain-containing protein n=1 Tax=Trifolium subterraneum TaxID=3900 RepID=A0A2Z6M4N3_TRISU|nr:hypothetical protein TSUD_257970 [Trifolium subterraneum]